MRLMIQHETRYRYASAPSSAIEVLRLTPCNSDTQSVREWRIVLSADAPLLRFEDAFGNITHTFTAPLDELGELTMTATGTVETSGSSGVITGARERLPLGVYLRETSLTERTPALEALAAEAKGASNGSALDFAHNLNRMINERIRYEQGRTQSSSVADEALAAGEGVCQDMAHIIIAAARAEGVPARYVSGYQFDPERSENQAGHAWAELHIADLGWVGFDPTAGSCSNEAYVRVAIGLDYLSASPVRGAVYGGEGEELDVTVTIDERGGWAPPLRGQSQSQSQSQ